jgi:hypothetical protein
VKNNTNPKYTGTPTTGLCSGNLTTTPI